MTASLLHRYEREQNRLLLSTLPQSGRGDYESVPDVNQQQLLARIALNALQRKGGH